jgi:hypothetical protein
MTSPSLPGFALIAEIGMSYVETISPTISRDDYNEISASLIQYLHGTITFDACRSLVSSKIHRDTPVVRLQEILSLPDDPLSYRADPTPDESGLSLRRRTRPWTSAEDQRLLGGVLRFGTDNWQQIAAYVGSGRNRAQCSQRWVRGLNPRISKRGWTREEDERLCELVARYGEKAWARIAAVLGNRSDVQCRYRYRQAGLGKVAQLPLLRKSNLTATSCVLGGMGGGAVGAGPMAEGEMTMKMEESRPYLSSVLLMPRATIHCTQTGAIVPQQQRRKEAVVGADPDSLASFLRSFQ